ARAENAAVFHGWEAAAITVVIDASPHQAIALGENCETYPRHAAKAVDALRAVGVDGPYGLALGPVPHTRVLETSEHGGYPLLRRGRRRAPGLSGVRRARTRRRRSAGAGLERPVAGHACQSDELCGTGGPLVAGARREVDLHEVRRGRGGGRREQAGADRVGP